MCNQKLKFGLLLAQAREQGIAFDAFATGHYARVALDAARQVYTLRRGLDATKDQSYFLARLTQAQLRQVIFPLGERLKSDVVRLAREAGFGDIADREESQDFIESESYAPLFGPGDDRPGPLVDTAGRTLGQHRGIVHYTVGQRQGLGVATGDRLHVKELRPETNTVVLGRREEVFSDACRVADVNWIAGEPPPDGTTCHIRLRYRHAGVAAVIRSLAGGAAVRMMAVEPAAEAAAGLPAEAGTPTAGARVPPSGGSLSGLQPRAEDAPAITQTAAGNVWQADFAAPQFAVAPGQAAVFYAGDEVLGGGWISR
jgi:tRNA-specific 2-thiouridylase